MTGFLIRLHGTHLQPDYQPGDVLNVRETSTAQEDQLAVVLTNDRGDTGVRRYRAADGHKVIGVVTDMYRVVAPGGAR